MKAAAIQLNSGPIVSANLDAAAVQIEAAARAGAGLVVLPENFALMPGQESERREVMESPGDGAVQRFLSNQSRKHGLWLVGGTHPMPGSSPERMRSVSLLFDDKGQQVARYDKLHLFDVTLQNGETYRESDIFEPGDSTVVTDTPVGRLGMSICYDLRFPELYRDLVSRGAEIIVVPSAFTATTGRAHWESLLRARAIENQVYLIAAAQGGFHANGRETWGHSMIVNPWGEVLASRATGAGCVVADIDLNFLRRVRSNLPALEHRRTWEKHIA